METVFDHDPTDEELIHLFGTLDNAREVREDAQENPGKQPDYDWMYLGQLFDLRGDTAKRNHYRDKIKDPALRLEFDLMIEELEG